VFGASERAGSVGNIVLSNLLGAGFTGAVHAINPKHASVFGQPCHPDLTTVSGRVDLAVVATPAASVPGIVGQCGEHGVRAAIVLSAGFAEVGAGGGALMETLLDQARHHDVRVLGPNCLGLACTSSRLNATFGASEISPGGLALVSQSGALCTAIVDWARDAGVGFSSVVSLGDAADIGFGEILDYLAMDEKTRAILLYVEGLRDGRRFMSGLRVAARFKPTLVLKAGRHATSASAARSHTGSIVGQDDIFDAALRRAGAVRVETVGQLFAAAQLLGSGHRSAGRRLAIVTNAGGPGVMAADRAGAIGVELAQLSSSTVESLDSKLPAQWSRANPVDILGDATPERYSSALSACLDDPNVDGVLAMLTPQAMTASSECARSVIELAKNEKPVVSCWMGGRQVAEGRSLFRERGVPHFNTPETSVDAFQYLWAHHHNQQLMLQVAEPLKYVANHDVAGARSIIESALERQRTLLSGPESKAVLRAFGMASTLSIKVRTANEALVAAETLGFPVVLKIDSPDISHKSSVGGVRMGISAGQQVRREFTALLSEVAQRAPTARLDGATVECMHQRRFGRELMVGVVRDPGFGPAISLGAGGTLVELLQDRSVGLPPLTALVVRDMIRHSRVAPLLGQWRGQPAVNLDALEEVLLRVSDLVCELPEVTELDINPLIVDENDAVAVDVRIVLSKAPPGARLYSHMAIHPYPRELSTTQQLADGTEVVMRPIRPEDAQDEQRFVQSLSSQSKFFRFMKAQNELTPEMLRRFTQIDYDREMAFVATVEQAGQHRQIGVSRYVSNPDATSCEFALVVADEWQHKGIGTRLMEALIGVARARGLHDMQGEVLVENHGMLRLVESLGFKLTAMSNDATLRSAVLRL
jgi:acetyltransferase